MVECVWLTQISAWRRQSLRLSFLPRFCITCCISKVNNDPSWHVEATPKPFDAKVREGFFTLFWKMSDVCRVIFNVRLSDTRCECIACAIVACMSPSCTDPCTDPMDFALNRLHPSDLRLSSATKIASDESAQRQDFLKSANDSNL